jgi:hypothetical protein
MPVTQTHGRPRKIKIVKLKSNEVQTKRLITKIRKIPER